jgi:hypothetical protein
VPHGPILRGHVVQRMPRAPSEALATPSSPGRPSRVLSRWRPCGALVFAPLAGRHRLREVVTSRASPADALASLGVPPPPRSTRAAAHARRPAARSHRLLATRSARGQAVAPGPGFRCQKPRGAVASPTLARGLNRCPGARDRPATGALQGQTLRDPAGSRPTVVVLRAGQRRARARGRQRPTGSSVALERGDRAERGRCRLTQAPVSCVSRQQGHATCTLTARVAGSGHHGVTADQPILRHGPKGAADPDVLRRGGSRAPETGPHAGVWTTAGQRPAAPSAALDTARWQSERCCTVRPPQRQRKTCLGTAETAGMPHIGVARMAYRWRAVLRFKSGVGLSCQP